MNDRLNKLMRSENLTSAKFAEIMSVQPSSISHLLSGRNKPNYDFIARFMVMFPNVNLKWFINGEGEMYESEVRTPVEEEKTEREELLYKDESEAEYTESNTLSNSEKPQEDNLLQEVTNVTTEQPQTELKFDDSAAVGTNLSTQNEAKIENQPSVPVVEVVVPEPAVSVVEPAIQPLEQPAAPIKEDVTNVESMAQVSENVVVGRGENVVTTPQVAPAPIVAPESVPGSVSEPAKQEPKQKQIVKVLFFYDDNTFEVFNNL